MKKAVISPSKLKGSITVPPSKSAMHRALICSALGEKRIEIKPKWNSDDIKATVSALSCLGADITETAEGYLVNPIKKGTDGIIDCCESGSTLRFLMPVAAALGVNAEFTGRGRLPERSIEEYTKLFPAKGVEISAEKMPYKLKGRLNSGEYKINSTLSSQYITGLLFALPLLDGDSVILPEAKLTSRGYIDMTLDIMKQFGVEVTEKDNAFYIKGNQKYSFDEDEYYVEGDWSQAAFFLTAKALGADISVKGVDFLSKQGDKEIAEILNEMGKSGSIKATEIDAENIPDLVPILSVAAVFAEGETRIFNAARLRAKESDRLKAMCEGLANMGAFISEAPDGLIILGGYPLKGGICKGYNDHRIVMALSIAAAFAEGVTEIDDAQSIEKSYPTFFEDYKNLGGNVNVINVG